MKVDHVGHRQNKDLAVAVAAVVTGPRHIDNRCHSRIEEVIIDGDFEHHLAKHVGLRLHAAENGSLVLPFGEFLGVAYRITGHADAREGLGQRSQPRGLYDGKYNFHGGKWNVTEIAALLHSLYSPHWAGATPSIKALGSAGGFSGARFWRITCRERVYCLRQWPVADQTRGDHLAWSHAVLRQARSAGCDFVPVPLRAADGNSRVSRDGHWWQLEPWMPGRADFEAAPGMKRLESAMTALARFHNATSQANCAREVPRALVDRISRIDAWFDNGRPTMKFQTVRAASRNDPQFGTVSKRICGLSPFVAPKVRRELVGLAQATFPVHPVIGDVWHDHLLFEGDQLTGIVDFGAMKIDHPALDIARLLGSLGVDDGAFWSRGVAFYRQIRDFSQHERKLADGYDRSSTLVSGLNWLEWVCVEGREPGPRDVVLARIERIAERLEHLAGPDSRSSQGRFDWR